jgi:hypothetical protein
VILRFHPRRAVHARHQAGLQFGFFRWSLA